MTAVDLSFVGKRVSLISRSSDVRYTGILTGSDPVASTIQLSNAYSMGTELRRPPDEWIPAATELYTYIVFRTSEVKNIAIDEPADQRRDVGEDPAVIGLQASEPPVAPNYPPSDSPSYSQQASVGVSPQPVQAPAESELELGKALVSDPEEGWDDDTETNGTVLQYGAHGQEVERRVAFTAKMVVLKPAAQGAFFFQKVFGDGDFLGSGHIVIPPNSTKPTKSAKDNTFVFYVIQGTVRFSVHQSSFIIATGGMFMVPRGNAYYIQNVCERDAKLFFVQGRKMAEDLAEDNVES